MRDRTDVSRPHHHDYIARAQYITQRRSDLLDALDEDRLDLAAAAHRAAHRAPVGVLDGRFAGRVHLPDQQYVDASEHVGEVIEQIVRAGVAVRLKYQHQPTAGPGLLQRFECGGDLGRMVTVVIDDADRAVADRHITDVLHAAVDALKVSECAPDGLITHAEL